MTDEQYMKRCLDLALKGISHVAPNPMVGCVIVHNDIIIGEGYHQKFGEAHAEVNAVNSVENQEFLKESTLYVNLEPCAHWGKTPPCANLIIEKKIPKVVIGCVDTFAKVSGMGIENMRAAGCAVKVGVLENESRELNRRFFTYYMKSRPYIILKWAQSADGFMDIDRTTGKKGINWITSPETKVLVHQWRSEEAAILVGKNTVINDNPELTVRYFEGPSPVRFVVDPENRIDLSAHKIGKNPPETYVIKSGDMDEILQNIKEKQCVSVIVEGGKFTIEKFLANDLWDEIRLLTGDVKLKSGLASPKFQGKRINAYSYGSDLIEIYRND